MLKWQEAFCRGEDTEDTPVCLRGKNSDVTRAWILAVKSTHTHAMMDVMEKVPPHCVVEVTDPADLGHPDFGVGSFGVVVGYCNLKPHSPRVFFWNGKTDHRVNVNPEHLKIVGYWRGLDSAAVGEMRDS